MKIPNVDIREKDSNIKRIKVPRDIFLHILIIVLLVGFTLTIILLLSAYHPQKVTEQVHKEIEQTKKEIDKEMKIPKKHDTIIIIENKKGPKGPVGPQGIP